MSGANGFVVAVPKHFLRDEKGPSVRIWLREQVLIDGKSRGTSIEGMSFTNPVDAPVSPFGAAQVGVRFAEKRVDQPEE